MNGRARRNPATGLVLDVRVGTLAGMISLRLPAMVIAGVAIGGSMWWKEHRRRRSVQARFAGRPAIAAGAFFETAPGAAERARLERFRSYLGRALHLDPETLGPADHFGDDLGGRELSRQALLFLISGLEREFGCVLPDAEQCLALTLGELFDRVSVSGS